MKKVVLFLCVIGVAAMMTSCLEGNHSTRDEGFAMIAQGENGVKYARLRGLFGFYTLTSREIQAGVATIPATGQIIDIMPGSFFYFTFSGDTTMEQVSLGENRSADNVILGHLVPVHSVSFTPTPAPEGIPEERFAIFALKDFLPNAAMWNDHWIFGATYMTGGGRMPDITFYRRYGYEVIGNIPHIEIDVRISNIPPTAQSQLSREDRRFLALNMSSIRRDFQQDQARNVQVRFNYYTTTGTGTAQVATPRSTDWITWSLAGTGPQR